jgi:hypothetical protein
MADLKIEGATQINPAPLTLGTTATTALKGDTFIPTKMGVIGISQATTGANGTHWPRADWTNYLSYIGDTSNGGYGLLVGTVQCNKNDVTNATTTMDTIYGFSATQSASLRMNGHGGSASEDIWYGQSGNNTVILNN